MSDQMNVLEAFPSSKEAAIIKKLLIVEVPVSNMQRAIEFYAGQLGFYINLEKNPPSIWPETREVFT